MNHRWLKAKTFLCSYTLKLIARNTSIFIILLTFHHSNEILTGIGRPTEKWRHVAEPQTKKQSSKVFKINVCARPGPPRGCKHERWGDSIPISAVTPYFFTPSIHIERIKKKIRSIRQHFVAGVSLAPSINNRNYKSRYKSSARR